MFAMIYCTILVVLSLFMTFPFYYSSKVKLIRYASLFFSNGVYVLTKKCPKWTIYNGYIVTSVQIRNQYIYIRKLSSVLK